MVVVDDLGIMIHLFLKVVEIKLYDMFLSFKLDVLTNFQVFFFFIYNYTL